MTQINKQSFIRRYRYYEILELSKNASQEEIKSAYRKLAKRFHPDVNPNSEAQEKFKKINEAYGILCNPTQRANYDNSQAECPICWTCEVIQTTGSHWRCCRCACKFNPSIVHEIIEQVDIAIVLESQRQAVRLFTTTQCSWCREFYTQPFLCPYGKLRSNCFAFKQVDEEERRGLLSDENWWWRMKDMIWLVQERGIMTKCRERGCFALNPNPQKTKCWQCGSDSLRCPTCATLLIYNIENDIWKCMRADCSKKFAYRPKIHIVERIVSQEKCPNCGKNLYLDTRELLFRCNNTQCRCVYTLEDLNMREKGTRKKTTQSRYNVESTTRKQNCPNCGKQLYYDLALQLYKCKNLKCGRVYTKRDLSITMKGKGTRVEVIQCPECGSATVVRVVKKGTKAGSKFHVCTRYPDCKGKVPLSD